MPSKSQIQVMIVDDSATARRILSDIINGHPNLNVMGAVADPYKAVEILNVRSPDVMILDVHMPHMDGVTFLKKIMRIKPMPVVMCSSYTERGSSLSLECLENGAVDIIAKPKLSNESDLQELETLVHDTILSATLARIRGKSTSEISRRIDSRRLGRTQSQKRQTADAILDTPNHALIERIPTTAPLIALGASTGGVEAIRTFLEPMPEDCPAIVMVQHMPEKFTAAFANRLNERCRISVREAKSGDVLEPGLALLAPGNRHMVLQRKGTRYSVEVIGGPLVNRHRPSVDVLFRSVASCAGRNAVGVILTGMGIDGAAGLAEMRNAGAYTLAQDEATSVVFGMPKEAIAQGGAERVVSLDRIGPESLQASAR